MARHPPSARYRLNRHAKRLDRPASRIEDEAVKKLVCYDYSLGNVAELEAAIERIVILADGEEIRSEEVFPGAASAFGAGGPESSQGVAILASP